MQRKLMNIVVAAALAGLGATAFAATGPSTTQTPYLVPVAPGVEFTSILSVGDVVRKKHAPTETYTMVGIPDGLGVYDNDDESTFTLVMNHELGNTLGVPRAHGAIGAFVSKWTIRKRDLAVLNGEDLIKTIELKDPTLAALGRFCSGDMAPRSAFYNGATDKGFEDGRIYMNGEETGPAGRAFAHIAEGEFKGHSYELTAFGNASWENLVASPYRQDKTIVAGMDDGSLLASKLYFFIGQKQEEGNPIERAGLTNGSTSQVKIADFLDESSVANGSTNRFTLVATGGTGLNRVEDGAWDTTNPNRFYFVTTASMAATGNSRLWRITFDDIAQPELGGKIEVLVDGGLSVRMMDNITVDRDGNVYMQEDVGNNAHLGKLWKYGTDGSLTMLAQHDEARFGNGTDANVVTVAATAPFTKDEESSGIIEVSHLFKDVKGYNTNKFRYFLLDVQAHYATGNAETVEGGQLLMMKVPK